MAGAYYIWILGTFAVGCGGVLLLLIGLFYIGHRMERKHTGATHGFLELPNELKREPKGEEPPEGREG